MIICFRKCFTNSFKLWKRLFSGEDKIQKTSTSFKKNIKYGQSLCEAGGLSLSSVFIYRLLRFVSVAVTILAGLFLLYCLSSLTYPFIFAWMIAFIMNPLVNFLQVKWKFPRVLAVLFVLIAIFGIIASLVTLLIFELVAGAEYLAKNLPDHAEKMMNYMEKWVTGSFYPILNDLAGF